MSRSLLAGGTLVLMAASLAACGFGVSLDGIFAGAADAGADVPVAPPADAAVDTGIPTVPALQVGAGEAFSCALRQDGTVACWGWNDQGRLGDNSTVEASGAPVLVRDVNDGVFLAVGEDHACVVRSSGKVACWGSNTTSQLGDGTSTGTRIPVTVVGIDDATEVSCGGHYTCVVRKSGTVSCWGANEAGQLGDGTTATSGQPITVAGLSGITHVMTMHSTTCALNGAGEVFCWGANSTGACGTGTAGGTVPMPTKVVGLSGVTALGRGSQTSHGCALTATDVRCWGSGSLGDGTGSDSATPKPVVGVTDGVSVTLGGSVGCVARKGGEAACWGANQYRQLGLGDAPMPTSVSSPVPVMGLVGVKQVAAGAEHVCALLEGGKVSCWGSNADGRLGRGTPMTFETPVKATLPVPASRIAAGEYHTCAVATSGDVYCWGQNFDGALGAGSELAITGTPRPVAGLSQITAIAARTHTCATAGGTPKCWGTGDFGQLGRGVAGPRDVPVDFGAVAGSAVGVGTYFSCAIRAGGSVGCSGYFANGRLGSTQAANVTSPIDVLGPGGMGTLSGATDLALGYAHACAVTGSGLVCWGLGSSGQTGYDASQANPAAVVLPKPPSKVVAGGNHTCVLFDDKSVGCFGLNDVGQLGATGGSGKTVRFPNLEGSTAVAISAGADHTCAIAANGSTYCWGSGQRGQIGNGLRGDVITPAKVVGLMGAKAVSAGSRHTCAIGADDAVYCWGSNTHGELGEGSQMMSGIPGLVLGY